MFVLITILRRVRVDNHFENDILHNFITVLLFFSVINYEILIDISIMLIKSVYNNNFNIKVGWLIFIQWNQNGSYPSIFIGQCTNNLRLKWTKSFYYQFSNILFQVFKHKIYIYILVFRFSDKSFFKFDIYWLLIIMFTNRRNIVGSVAHFY